MKKIIILTISVLMLLFSVNIVCASEAGSEGISGLVTKSWDVVGVIAWCGYAVSLGMMIYIGIKYMLGSVDAKANMKSALISYLIGAAFVFCASTIAMVVANLAAGVGEGGGLTDDLADQIVKGANSVAGRE